jgi:predicted HAD superfamily Cof-like phosphohydrolase
MLQKMLGQVERFHREVTGMPIPERPTMLEGEAFRSAMGHLREELEEFANARTVEAQGDAMVDLAYLALGRLVQMGILPGPAFEEVHEANMRKCPGVTKRGTAHDAAKPSDWTPPDLSRFLSVTREDVETIAAIKARVADVHITDAGRLTRMCAGRRPRPKILVLGYGRHGKDTVSGILSKRYGLTFTSSSEFCAEHVVLPYFRQSFKLWSASQGPMRKEMLAPPTYRTWQECYADRHSHRAEWYQAIKAFNSPDASALGKAIFSRFDIYCGLRSDAEFFAVRDAGLYDLCLWVDRSEHLPPESEESCTVKPGMADVILDNNGSFDHLQEGIMAIMRDTFHMEPIDG